MTSTKRQFKASLYGQLARVGKALSSGTRLEILDLLCQGPRSVEAIAAEVEQSMANTSHHLQALRRSGLIESERDGVRVVYRVADDDVRSFFGALRRVSQHHLAEIDRITRDFLEDQDAFDPVDQARLVERVQRGEVTVLDVRPPDEFEAGHLPQAISIPLSQLRQRLRTLPKRREIVAYCRGPYCVMAIEAVELLRARGYRAHRLDDGISEWRARGLPLETNPEVTQ